MADVSYEWKGSEQTCDSIDLNDSNDLPKASRFVVTLRSSNIL